MKSAKLWKTPVFSIGALRLTGEFSNVKVNNDEHVRIGDKNFHFVGVNNQMLNGPVTILMAEKKIFLTPKLFKNTVSLYAFALLPDGQSG